MTADVYYTVTYGKGDGSDTMESEVVLTDEEAAIYEKAKLLRMPMDEIPELEQALSRAYDEIEADEMDLSCELGDEYAQECEDEDISPFDEGWSLDVFFPEPDDEEVEEDEARNALTYLFKHAAGDYSGIEEYIERINDFCGFACDERELVHELAQELGCSDYTEDFTFTIHISDDIGDSEIDYPVTMDELDLINEAMDNGDSFEDVQELSDLYDRIMEVVPEKLEEDLQENNDAEIDPDDLDYTLDFE